jgi:hypothetical protein
MARHGTGQAFHVGRRVHRRGNSPGAGKCDSGSAGRAHGSTGRQRTIATGFGEGIEMKIREVSMNKSLILTLSFAICVGVAARANADKVYMKVGPPMQVRSIVWIGSENQYSVETATGVKLPIDRSKVDHVEVAKPPAWDKAVQLFTSGNMAEAIPALESIVSGYQMLGWDNKARD